jgi:hypothetical protein
MDPWTIGRTSVHSPRWTTDRNSGQSSPERSSPGFPWIGPHRDGAGSKRRGRDLYPGWHETAEGLRRSGDGGPRWWPEFLDEKVLEVRKGGERGRSVERWRWGRVL